MRKKVFIILFINIALLILLQTVAYAGASINEKISVKFQNYVDATEYKIEITDDTDKKITIRFKDGNIIDCFAENKNGTLDLKEITQIGYWEKKNTYYLETEYFSNEEYLLDCNKEYKYSVYINNKLVKETKIANAKIDQSRGNKKKVYYIFSIEYDKIEDVKNKAYNFSGNAYRITYAFTILGYVYIRKIGIRRFQSKKYGGTINEKDVDYYRDIPIYNDYATAFASLYYCSNISEKKLKNGIIGAYILKWSNEDKITIIDKGDRVFSIDLKDGDFEKTPTESEVYHLLRKAAGENHILDNNELKIWSRKHNKEIKEFYNRILTNIDSDINLKDEAKKILGLKKFLLNYSLIDEKRHIEIKIWENYLIFAQILGISDKVTKQFTQIYPDYSKMGNLLAMSLDDIIKEYISLKLLLLILTAPALFVEAVTYVLYINNL